MTQTDHKCLSLSHRPLLLLVKEIMSSVLTLCENVCGIWLPSVGLAQACPNDNHKVYDTTWLLKLPLVMYDTNWPQMFHIDHSYFWLRKSWAQYLPTSVEFDFPVWGLLKLALMIIIKYDTTWILKLPLVMYDTNWPQMFVIITQTTPTFG